jgi:hypothetical protein
LFPSTSCMIHQWRSYHWHSDALERTNKSAKKKIYFTLPVIVILVARSIYNPLVTAHQAFIFLPFCDLKFILPLVVCSHILQAVVPITAMLQSISCHLIEAVSECQTLIRHIKTERNGNSVYNTLNDEVVDLVEQFCHKYMVGLIWSQFSPLFKRTTHYHKKWMMI